jgi:hypothetical protein
MMREIFSCAHLVLLGLGTLTPQLSLATSTLRLFEANGDLDSDEPDYTWVQKHQQLWERAGSLEPNEVWTALEAFFKLPYWTRIWIVQEIVVSRRALLLIGDELLQFQAYKAFLHFLTAFGEPRATNNTSSWFDGLIHNVILTNSPTMTMAVLPSLQAIIKRGSYVSLPTLLAHFKEGYAASDPRDLIFAVLGISKFAIKPDYSKTILEVYTLVTINWVDYKFKPCLDFFLCSGYGQNTTDISWPSWVPDWRAMQNGDFLTCPWVVQKGTVQHSADLNLPAGNFKLELTPILCVPGVLTDCIVSLDNPVGEIATIHNVFKNTLRLILNSARPNGFSESCLAGLLGCLIWDVQFKNEDEKREFAMAFLSKMGDFITKTKVKGVPQWLQDAFGKSKPTKNWTLLDIRSVMIKELFHRRICHTSGGRIVAASPKTEIGDFIAVIPGCSCPILLRKVGNHFIHLGPCFADGLMNGEVAKMLESGEVKMEDIEIH